LNQHQGCCQAPASKPYCCVTAASALITGPSLQMRQAGRAVTFHFLQLQGSSRALYPFQELPILAARHQDHQPAVPRCRQQGRRSTCQWPQRQTEQAHKAGTGENIVHDIAKKIHSISHHWDIPCDKSYDIACDIASKSISYAISYTISHILSCQRRVPMRYRMRYRNFLRYRMRYRTFFCFIASVNDGYKNDILCDIACDIACVIAFF